MLGTIHGIRRVHDLFVLLHREVLASQFPVVTRRDETGSIDSREENEYLGHTIPHPAEHLVLS